MIIRRKCSQVKLKDLLKADPFSRELLIRYDARYQYVPVMTKSDFFDQVYADVAEKKIKWRDGSRNEVYDEDIDVWEKEVAETENSLVIFIEGYAGCGKSVFVQHFLKQQLGIDGYEYNYYNYDIAAYPRGNVEEHHILPSLVQGFISHLTTCVIDNPNVVRKFKELVSQEEIKYIDKSLKISNNFVNSKVFAEAEKRLKADHKAEMFRVAVNTQLEKMGCEHILALDFVLRLANYIENGENPVIYICYDNLDAIEDIQELYDFINMLISSRRNVDTYINKTEKNYSNLSTPRIVLFSTYRKITAARVELANLSERCGDISDEHEFIQYIEGSNLYNYQDIVENRRKFFDPLLNSRHIGGDKIRRQFDKVAVLSKLHFVKVKYAGLWNNNYRVCSNILNDIFTYYERDIDICIALQRNKTDGFDEESSSYYGASAVFLYVVCRLFQKKKLWGREHLNLVPLREVPSVPEPKCSELTSLSRLILTYIYNKTEVSGEQETVSLKELFDEFNGLYSGDEICACLNNMLTRDSTGTWRRPIYYNHKAIPSDKDTAVSLTNQWDAYISNGKDIPDNLYTEFSLCECGEAYINLMIPDFECFAVRAGNKQSLYMTTNPAEIEVMAENVVNAVKCCCKNMTLFSQKYMNIKSIDSYDKYIKCSIHPRTASGNPQLHTERFIFSHIFYLDKYRLCHIRNMSGTDKERANTCIIKVIGEYLDLYNDYIRTKNPERELIAEMLRDKMLVAQNANEEKDRFISIQVDWNEYRKLQDKKGK